MNFFLEEIFFIFTRYLEFCICILGSCTISIGHYDRHPISLTFFFLSQKTFFLYTYLFCPVSIPIARSTGRS